MSTDINKITIISGGTATNELVSLFSQLSNNNNVSYILPISDNGGSTSEIIRVIGGPAIGDIRSRLTRLIPNNQESLRNLLSFRLSPNSQIAKQQWNEIVEGTHELWNPISSSTKEIFRCFFVHLHVELLKRSRIHQSTKRIFRYELANIGNLFLTGVRLFIGSLDSSIELFCKLTGIDSNINVLPCINTNFTYHISALLENGFIITGQSQISHPSELQIYPPPINKTRPPTPTDEIDGYFEVPVNEVAMRRLSIDSFISDEEESGNVPQYTHPELKKSQLHFNKSENIEPLKAPIKRIFYISPYGEEIKPAANNRCISTISNTDVLVYSIGSLMTSIIPVIILKGIGKAIANSQSKKVLLLNGCLDRETFGMTALDFVKTIVEAAEYSQDKINEPWNKYVTHLLYMKNPKIKVDVLQLEVQGIKCIHVDKIEGTEFFDLNHLQSIFNHTIF
ncbi:unnamed protein product [Candida verbasci]|uniref:Uncharacterized protein n=1 Tax=Candida verbasci TaxID=1227364 RepID=A0A9W4XN93_9ASCO|nr:unnamed protein product [Candida verbasci]